MKTRDGIVRAGGVDTGRIFQWAHLEPYLRVFDKARLVAFTPCFRWSWPVSSCGRS